MARIADKAGWDDPMSNLAAIVQVIDATANQDANAADVETVDQDDAEMDWPEAWTEEVEHEVIKHEPLDTGADEDQDYAFGSTFVTTSVDPESNTQTGPPAQQDALIDGPTAEGAHASSASGVSDTHNLLLTGANTGVVNVLTLKADAQATFDTAVNLWTGAYGAALPTTLDFVIAIWLPVLWRATTPARSSSRLMATQPGQVGSSMPRQRQTLNTLR
jgi:hypothetical protein